VPLLGSSVFASVWGMKIDVKTRRKMTLAAMAISGVLVSPGLLQAGNPSVLEATVEVQTGGLYAFQATVGHDDEGWSHYVERIEVASVDGVTIAARPIFTPHKSDSKVFIKSLSNVEVPIGVTEVIVRAVCSVDGVGTRTVRLKLPPR